MDSLAKIKYDKQVKLWEHFFKYGEVIGDAVDIEVIESWKRSLLMGIKPNDPRAKIKMTLENLRVICERNEELIGIALPFMETLRDSVKDSGFLISLADKHGVLLEIIGNKDAMSLASCSNFVKGCCRTESEAGTNAIGLCLTTKKPVQVSGAEHFNALHHLWTCSSAPIFSDKGKVLGVLTLSGESDQAHPHTLGMVISAAQSIIDKLKKQTTSQLQKNMTYMVDFIVRSISEAIIIFNNKGVITRANQKANQLVGLDIDSLQGAELKKVFPQTPELIESLENGKSLPLIDVDLQQGRKKRRLEIKSYIFSEHKNLAGGLLFLTEKNCVRKPNISEGLKADYVFDDICGTSSKLIRQIELAKIVAETSSRVLIVGESGTGKEIFAQAIHNASDRRKAPFVAINCAAIPKDLVEAEIMGYVSGAYTGAKQGGQIGKLELANGGTIFLDEIQHMPLDVQAKFLRVLQENMITRLGDTKPIKIDVRVIAATNEDLYEKSLTHEFRHDLFYRLSVIEIKIPPLRERIGDLILTSEVILNKLAEKLGKKSVKISSEVLSCLTKYTWPGNVRELENVLEMGFLLCKDNVICLEDLNDRVRSPHKSHLIETYVESKPISDTINNDESYCAIHGNVSQTMKDVEYDKLRDAMFEANGNIVEVSRSLGISRSTIYRRMKEFGLNKVVKIR